MVSTENTEVTTTISPASSPSQPMPFAMGKEEMAVGAPEDSSMAPITCPFQPHQIGRIMNSSG